MEFGYDPTKSEKNKDKHGIDFEEAWAEKTDVAADFPKVVQELSEKLDSWKASLPITPSKNGLSNARKKVLKK